MPASAKKEPLLSCSFCQRDSETVNKLIGGPGVYICDTCVEVCNQILDGKPSPVFPGWDSLTDAELLRTLAPAAATVRSVADTLTQHVHILRERGVTWTQIGKALGVSRQAAWERFS